VKSNLETRILVPAIRVYNPELGEIPARIMDLVKYFPRGTVDSKAPAEDERDIIAPLRNTYTSLGTSSNCISKPWVSLSS